MSTELEVVATNFDEMLQDAKNGNREAQYEIGKCYENGFIVGKNLNTALKWYEKAARQGLIEAKNNVGAIYMQLGNEKEGRKWLKKAADQGYSIAQKNYAILLENEGNYAEAFKYYDKAAENVEYAKLLSALFNYSGKGTEKNVAKCVSLMESLLHAEDSNIKAFALMFLGGMYFNGEDPLKQDTALAIEMLTKATNFGNCIAAYNLGVMYYEGDIERDYSKAFEYIEKACLLGYEKVLKEAGKKDSYKVDEMDAFSLLGECFLLGRGTEKNVKRAIECYQKAYSLGSLRACHSLGVLYYSGIEEDEVEKNIILAQKYLTEAADKNYAVSQFFIGANLIRIQSNPEGVNVCIEYLSRAGQNGLAHAYTYLGNLYSTATDDFYDVAYIQKDDKKAFFYYKAAEDDPEALYMLGYYYHYGIYIDPKQRSQAGFDKDKQRETAREYYVKAKTAGFNCDLSIDSIDYLKNSKNRTPTSRMFEYTQDLIRRSTPEKHITELIRDDLIKECGNAWSKLSDKSKSFLITGIYSFAIFIEMGEKYYKDLDFTTTITPLCKALELELCRIFFTGFIDYLQARKVDPQGYVGSLAEKDKASDQVLFYDGHNKGPKGIQKFHIGSLEYIFGRMPSESSPCVSRNNEIVIEYTANKEKFTWNLDNNLILYFNSITTSDTFPGITKQVAMSNYLFELAGDAKQIARELRNKANHQVVMNIRDAELCGDYILKMKRILIKLVSMIDYEKINEYDPKVKQNN